MRPAGDTPSRRRFCGLLGGSAALALLGVHDELALGGTMSPRRSRVRGHDPLILGLKLLTAAPLAEMRAYYRDLLGFEVIEETGTSLTVQAGLTPITFTAAKPDQGRPLYHFAFNIPENKIRAARAWQLQRTELVQWRPDQSDPEYPNDVRHFRNWNAHSVFFWDPADNILEYIARHDLPNAAPEADSFSTQDILYASEIGFVVDDQDASARTLKLDLGLPVYPKGESFWWAMGDERGLLLCIPERRWGTDPKKQVTLAVHPTQATIRGAEARRYAFENYPYEVIVQ